MFGCLILFLCELVYVCVYVLLSVSVCTASVRQPLFDRQKLRLKNAIFNVRLCGIVFVRACLCVCVCFTLYYYLSLCLYSVCASTIDVRAAKTEVKKCDFQCSVVWCCFGVSLFMCVCVIYCLCLFVQRLCVNRWGKISNSVVWTFVCTRFLSWILSVCQALGVKADVVFVWACMCVCVLISASVCTASVRQQKLR